MPLTATGSTPRRRSTAVLSALLTLLLPIAGVTALVPAAEGAPAPSTVTVTKVTAAATRAFTGTTVRVSVGVKVPASNRTRVGVVRIFMVGKGQTYALGSARGLLDRSGGHVTMRASLKTPRSVPAGRYTVRACHGHRPARSCQDAATKVTIAPALLVAAPAALSIGDVPVGSASAPQSVTLTNRGQATTGAVTTAVTGAGFSVAGSTCARSLKPGASCRVSVVLTPGTPGATTGSLTASGQRAAVASVALRGTGLGAAMLAVSPVNHDFGDTAVGASSDPVALTVTNVGNLPSGVLDATLAPGSALDFTITSNTCTTVLAPAATCTVSVAFNPTTVGRQTSGLTVSGAPGGSVTTNLAGTGTGAADLTISPANHEFDDTLVGSGSDPVDITVTNEGNLPSGVPDVTLTPEATDDFAITANGCTVALAPAATCTVTVAFTPTASGERTGGLSVSATPGGSVSTDLSGTGLAPASLSFDPASAAFGDEVIGDTTDSQTLTLTNDGDVASGTLSIALDGDAADQYTIVGNDCAATLAAHDSCDVDVAFAPTASGTASAELDVSGIPGGEATATLGGIGQTQAELSISETTYNFGYSNDPVEHVFTVTNDGDATSGDAVVQVDGSGVFAVTTNTCTTALSGGDSCDVGVTYIGSGSTDQTSELSVTAVPGGAVTADLTGSPQALTVAPVSHDFGGILVGNTSDAESFVLTNHRLTSVQVDGEGVTGPFPLDSSCFPVVIPAGGTCTFSASFAPTSPGPASGVLDYSAQGGFAEVEVSGNGLTPAAFSLSPSTLDFGAYAPGDVGTQQVTITNTGTQTSDALSFSVTGPDAEEFYTSSSDCPSALAGGDSCTVTMGFAPITLGDKTATFDVAGAPGGAASLIGLGAPAGVTLYPTTHDYGAVAVGGASYFTFRVVNTTDNGEDMNSASSGPPFPLELNQDFTCVLVISTIQPHRWCTMTLSFKPQSIGSFSTTLTAGGTNFNTQSQLSGIGVPARAASLSQTRPGAASRPQAFSIALRRHGAPVVRRESLTDY